MEHFELIVRPHVDRKVLSRRKEHTENSLPTILFLELETFSKADFLKEDEVAWLRVDTQTILTIAGHVITKNHRIAITHSDQRTWSLHIREVKESDQGWYMCQINTDPMKSQTAHLQVVGNTDIQINRGKNDENSTISPITGTAPL
ncbi:hypothetical protein RUM44_010174 [Polyplax serrata]|uniref:Immunoglobulin I-set domain-containing protein n=1 Tax=Polyplax serrata TaxID=468196 RepID=A0ABR1AUU5_POLSC